MNLSEFLNRYPQFKKYYDLLKDYLPDPKEIEVFKLENIEDFGFKVRETVFACAIQPNKLFFKQIPPNTHTFVHELIHLCKKPGYVEEEIYAYNLVDAVIFMVENDIKANPFKLFGLTKAQVLEVLKEFGFSSFEEFYATIGIIPHIYMVSEDGLVLEAGITEQDEIIVFLSELTSGLIYEPLFQKIFKALLTEK